MRHIKKMTADRLDYIIRDVVNELQVNGGSEWQKISDMHDLLEAARKIMRELPGMEY